MSHLRRFRAIRVSIRIVSWHTLQIQHIKLLSCSQSFLTLPARRATIPLYESGTETVAIEDPH